MKTSLPKLLLIVSVLLVFYACSQPDPIPVGKGRVALNVQGTIPLSARNLSRSAVASLDLPVNDVAGTQIGTITLTTAQLVLKEIELELAESEVDTAEEEAQNNEIQFNGPFIVDLLADTITPPLNTADILPGTYNEIKLKLDKLEGDEVDEDGTTPLVDSNDPLFSRSIYLAGTYTGITADGAVTDIPFTLSFDLDEEFELTGAADTALGFAVNEGAINDIIIAFRLNKWFLFDNTETNPDSIDFASLLTQNSAIVLDTNASDDNHTINEVIRKNIKESADYGKDNDHDNSLEPEEDDDPDTEDAHDE